MAHRSLSSPRASLTTRTLVAALIVANVLLPIRVEAFMQRPPARPVIPPITPPPAAPVVKVNRTVPKVTPPPAEPVFSANPRKEEIRAARIFGEPLVPVGEPSADENRALVAALRRHRADPHDETGRAITDFLTRYPESAWRPSLLANLGSRLKQQGYFSRALALWEQAWQQAKGATAPDQVAVADYALGEWLELSTKFGHADAIEARLKQIEGRDVRGSAAGKVWQAREGLMCFRERHHDAVSSGAVALQVLLNAVRPGVALPAPLLRYHPTPAGTTLVELRDLARASDLPVRMIKRRPDSAVPLPAIVHLRSDHYSTILAERNGRYLLSDPILGDGIWVSKAALDSEGTGYALIPETARVDASWAVATDAEARLVIGHCAHGSPTSRSPPCDVANQECCIGASAVGDGEDADGDDDSSASSGGGCGAEGCNRGMAGYSFHPVQATLEIFDTPVSYKPPRGPAVHFTLTYMHRDQMLPQVFAFGNLGNRWTHNWLSYVTDDPTQATATVAVYLRGAGQEDFPNPDGDDVFPAYFRSKAVLVRTTTSPIRYERRLPDGSLEVFSQSDGTTGVGRRIFLTELRNPQGQSVTLTYDSQFRLVALTDAVGQVTTLDYAHEVDPLKITRVTDPFGRFASLAYDELGRLRRVADPVGITSTFSYEAYDFIGAMTTPYGTTTFRHEPWVGGAGSGTARFIEATDPLGAKERLEWRWSTAAFPATLPASEVPTGFATANAGMDHYVSLYWDKRAMASGGQDSQAVLLKWLLGNEGLVGTFTHAQPVPHSRKAPLESRIWYHYDGQGAPGQSIGSSVKPIVTARVLDNGSTQAWQATYNELGHPTSRTDPLGRRTSYTYAANGIDLLEVRQTTGTLVDLLAAYGSYTAGHQPQSMTDAAGQSTALTYNGFGQVVTATNALNESTTFAYNTNGRLQSVTGSVAGAITTYTYDGYGRLRTATDSDGYTLTTDYDGLDRSTRTTYPDGTYEETVYARLDAVRLRDRLGRWTHQTFDPLRRLTSRRDPSGRTIQQAWCACGSLDAIVDAKGQRTSWQRDVQGRVTAEVRGDGTTTTTYTYDISGRLKTVTDPKQQITTYSYGPDSTILGVASSNAQIATSAINYTYEPAYMRLATMLDGTGTTVYTYHPVGSAGAGQLATVDGPLLDDTIAYDYDALGRVAQRTLNGAANGVTWTRDALGRITSEANALGTFTYGYDGVTRRLSNLTFPNGQTSTYTYVPTIQDHRLQTIHHRYAGGATLSKSDYTYDAVGNILTWRQQAEGNAPVLWEYEYDPADQLTRAVHKTTEPSPSILKRFAWGYDAAGNRLYEQIDDSVTSWTYDSLNRLAAQVGGGTLRFAGTVSEPASVTVGGQPAAVSASGAFERGAPVSTGTSAIAIVATDAAGNTATASYEVTIGTTTKTFIFDANGNLTSDGSRAFEWDARDQLVAVTLGTHRTEFSYDGLGRRVRLVEKEQSVVQSDIAMLWCEIAICEERQVGGTTVQRRAFVLGEQVAGQARYFTADHLGSVQEVTNSASTLLARYSFAPWGQRTVTAGTDVTTVGFTGHQTHASVGLALAPHRGYDWELGKWVSEDPLGMVDGLNLYAYVSQRPVSHSDPTGEFGIAGAMMGMGIEVAIQAWTLAARGCDIWAVGNYQLGPIAAAGAMGAMGPGVFRAAARLSRSPGAKAELARQLGRAKSASRRAKLADRIDAHEQGIKDDVVVQVAIVGITQSGKAMLRRPDEQCICR